MVNYLYISKSKDLSLLNNNITELEISDIFTDFDKLNSLQNNFPSKKNKFIDRKEKPWKNNFYLPDNLEYLIFHKMSVFNKSIIYPTKIKEIHFGLKFNQSLDLSNLKLLEKVIFGSYFNQEIRLPSHKLKFISLGYYFNQKIHIPNCKTVIFSRKFNNTFTGNIEELYLNKNFKSNLQLTNSLRVLKITSYYCQNINCYPLKLNTLIIDNLNSLVNLPMGLKKIDVKVSSLDDVTIFPNNLEKLIIMSKKEIYSHFEVSNKLKYLNSNIKFTINKNNIQVLKIYDKINILKFPNLKEIYYYGNKSFNDIINEKLPNNLEYLKIWNCCKINTNIFNENIKELHIPYVKIDKPCYLPNSLEKIYSNDDIFKFNMENLNNLVELDVIRNESGVKYKDYNLILPKNLIKLSLDINIPNLNIEFNEKLEYLNIACSYKIKKLFLPKSLKKLVIKSIIVPDYQYNHNQLEIIDYNNL
jgi:hypothetical protein